MVSVARVERRGTYAGSHRRFRGRSDLFTEDSWEMNAQEQGTEGGPPKVVLSVRVRGRSGTGSR